MYELFNTVYSFLLYTYTLGRIFPQIQPTTIYQIEPT